MKKSRHPLTLTPVRFSPSKVRIRRAKVGDIPQLVLIENQCFNYDQLSRRSFHWMIKKAHSLLFVLEWEKKLIGYGLVLINSGTSLARLYSICTLREFQGYGLAQKLLSQLEASACEEENSAFMRLEVKSSNKAAIKLYEKLGYKKFTEKKGYYDDGETALCFEKQIRSLKASHRQNVPYFTQGTEFTCGPASLLMAMKAHNPKVELSLSNELHIWREATTIFMTSGHGGCGPHGLALSAWRRGYKVEMYLSHNDVLFLNSVRSREKKKIIELVQTDFEKKIAQTNVRVHKKKMTLPDLKEALKKGGIPLVLITTYHFDNHRAPHWVVVTAYDDHFIYLHDPDQFHTTDFAGVESRMHIPVPEEQFLKISRWGSDRLSAAVVVFSD